MFRVFSRLRPSLPSFRPSTVQLRSKPISPKPAKKLISSSSFCGSFKYNPSSIRFHQIGRFFSTSRSFRVLSSGEFESRHKLLLEKVDNAILEAQGSLDRSLAESLADEVIELQKLDPRTAKPLGIHIDPTDNLPTFENIIDTQLKPIEDYVHLKYKTMISFARDSHDHKLAVLLYDELLQRQVEFSAPIMNMVLQTLLSNGEPRKALQILQESKKHYGEHFKMDIESYCTVLQIHFALGDLNAMASLYHEVLDRNMEERFRMDMLRVFVSTLIASAVQLGHREYAKKVYEDVRSKTPYLVQTPLAQEAMIEAYCDSEQYKLALSLFEEVSADLFVPQPNTFIKVIVSFLKQGDKHAAESLTEGLHKQHPGSPSFEQICRIAENYESTIPSATDESAVTAFKERPSYKTCFDAITWYSKIGRVSKAAEILLIGKATTKTMPITAEMYHAIIRGAIRIGDAQIVRQTLAEMEESHPIAPSILRQLVHFYIKVHDHASAVIMFKKFLDQYPNSLDSELCHRIILLHSIGAPSKLQRAVYWYDTLIKALPSTLDVDFFNASISVFIKIKDATKITEAFAEMKKRSVLPNTGTYNCMMELYLIKPDYKMVIETYSQMLRRKLSPNVSSMLSLLTAFGETRTLNDIKIIRFLQAQFISHHILPEPALMDALMKACQMSGTPGAFGLFLKIFSSKYQIELDAGNYFSWLSALLENDNLEEAIMMAAKLVQESKSKHELLTHDFCALLALHISKEAHPEIQPETFERWILEKLSKKPLSVPERKQFKTDLEHWRKNIGSSSQI